jgi:pSer/pThr/pTyr-binding forkhead associated (FHA) protein
VDVRLQRTHHGVCSLQRSGTTPRGSQFPDSFGNAGVTYFTAERARTPVLWRGMSAQPGLRAARASQTLPHIVALQPDVEPALFVLDEPESTIGRGAMCEVVVPFAFVSRLHSCIELVGGRYQIRDRRSVNGTYVNGVRVERPHVLTNNDGLVSGRRARISHTPIPTLR